MLANRRFKRFLIFLLIIAIMAVSGFFVLKYTNLIQFHCSVTLDGNGYELEEDTLYVNKGETVDLPEPNREGYTFNGWYLGEIKWTDEKPITSNIVLLAKWTPIPYEITFLVEDQTFKQMIPYDTMPVFDGTPTKESDKEYSWYEFVEWKPVLTVVKGPAVYTAVFKEVIAEFKVEITSSHKNAAIITGAGTYKYDSDVTVILEPNNGYIFEGWFNKDNSLYSKELELHFPKINKNIFLIAKFSIITKQINYFDTKGATNENPTSFDVSMDEIKLKPLSVTGYTFKGWYTEANGSGEKIETINCSNLIDYNLYAYFVATKFTITYHLDGGKLAEGSPTFYTIESSNITLLPPTKERYTFIGWTNNDIPDPTINVTIESGSTGNKSFTANWIPTTYTITFIVNGETYQQQVLDGHDPIFEGSTEIPSPPHVSITFIGWQPSIVPATENATYTAVYSYDYEKHTVKLQSNIYAAGTLTGSGVYDHGTDVEISAEANKGFTFIGWYRNGYPISTDSPYTIENINQSYVIEARFQEAFKTITYLNTRGATNNNLTKYSIYSGLISLNPLSIDGYDFTGWFTEENGAGHKISEIDSLEFIDYTLYAHFTLSEYTISYNLNEGTLSTPNPTSYTIESEDITLNNPTKEHYTFLGWTSLDITTPTTTITIEHGSMGDKAYTANWQANLYDITFIIEGVSEVKQFAYNTMPDYGSTPTKANTQFETYSFIGWSPQLAIVTGNATYTAQFATNISTFTLTLIAKPSAGGNVQGGGTYGYNATISISATANTGYTFDGWYQGNTPYSPDANTTINGLESDLTLTAKFNLITKTITYENTKGATNNNPTSYNITTNNITLKNISTTGYTFLGWFTQLNGGEQVTTITTSTLQNYTLYAHWSTDTYSITYNLNDGDPVSNPTSYTIESESFTLNNPTKPGYTFLGWTGTGLATATKNVTIAKGSTGDRSYTATWAINKYKLTFIVDGEIWKELDYNYGTENPNPGTPTKTKSEHISYEFSHWTPTITKVTKDATYTAVFIEHISSYTVTLQRDSLIPGAIATLTGSGSYEYGTNVTISATMKHGYSFVGWYYENGTELSSTSTYTIANLSSNITLIAKCSYVTREITYLNTKGAVNNNPTSYNISYGTITLLNLSKEGYTFEGWYTDANGTGSKVPTINTSTLDNYTLYAHWTPITYTISYTLNGGTVSGTNPTSYTIETTSFTLINPTKEGYAFEGWTGTGLSTPTKNITIAIGSYGSRNYIANWEVITYTITYNLDDGEIDGSNPTTYTIESATFTLINPTKDGYIFVGWSGTGIVDTSSSVTITKGSTGNREYTAVFEAIVPTYGTAFRPVNNQGLDDIDYGQGQTFTDNITYCFEGENQTLRYAPIYGTPSYLTYLGMIVIKLDDSVHIVAAINNAINTIESTEVDSITDFESLSIVVTTTANTSISVEISNYDILIVAYFKIVEYEIAYIDTKDIEHSNIESFTLLEDGSIALNDLDVPEGYIFNGWYTGSNGSGTKLSSTISRSYLINLATDYTINIYAYITLKEYTITYNLNGGSVSDTNPTKYTIETPTFTLNNPTKTGYNFIGWKGTGVLSNSTVVTITKGSTGNKTFTAYWKTNVVTTTTITFVVDGTTLTEDSITASSGSVITAPSVDSSEYGMTGYNVDGWYTDSNCTNKYTFSTMPTTNITLYGEWDYFIYQGFYPYLEEFKSATTSNITYIDSYTELVAWVDYVFFYKITEQYKISPTYKTFTSLAYWKEEINNAVDYGRVYPYTTYYYVYAESSTIGYVWCSTKDLDKVCKKSADSSGTYTYTQQEYAFTRDYTQVRSNSNANFKLNKVSDTIEVSTSNQLMYALEIGLKPICISGSAAESIYNKAKKVLNQICDDSMSDVDKIQAIYEWLILNVQYDHYAVDYCQSTWWEYDAWYAEGVFNNGVAVCDGIAKAFSILAKIENIPVVRVGGDGHAWNKVYINGNWYGVDATHGDIGDPSYKHSMVTYNNFLFTDSFKTSQGYTGDIRSDIIADTEYNYFDNVSFTCEKQEFDFVINSQAEFTLLLSYIKSTYDNTTTTYLSFEIILGSEVIGNNIWTMLNTGLTAAGYGSISKLLYSPDYINSSYTGYLICLET